MAEYCNDHFKMVEDTDDSFRLWQGLVGPCYTPVMSNDGTLSWTNNGNLPNPEAVNIRGPQGAGIRIAGIVDSVENLPASAADGAIWLVGEGSPYEGYAWISSGWIDLGPLTVGPAGPPGPQGDDYELTEADKQEIAEISESILLTELDNEPLGVRYGGTGARTVEGAKQMLGIDDITDKLGTWPLGTDAQDVAGAINEMIGEIDLQVADIEQLKNNFAGEFSPTSTYTVGTYAVYDGAFWRCTTAVTTAGSWTGNSNWTQVTAGGELKTANTNISTIENTLETLGTYVKPNLLDNWFFGNGVINQRGQATYSSTGYFLDRWKNTSSNNSQMQISSAGLKVTNSSGSGFGTISQFFENDLGGFKVTASLLFSDGSLLSGTGVFPNVGDASVTLISRQGNKAGVILENQSGSHPAFTITSNPSSTFTLVAAKLEIGETQTLAHEESGVWLLNGIPNHVEELAKCQRFCLAIDGTTRYPCSFFNANAANFFIPTPSTLRGIPSVEAGGTVEITTMSSTTALTGFTFNYNSVRSNCLVVVASKTAHGQTSFSLATKNVVFSADL